MHDGNRNRVLWWGSRVIGPYSCPEDRLSQQESKAGSPQMHLVRSAQAQVLHFREYKTLSIPSTPRSCPFRSLLSFSPVLTGSCFTRSAARRPVHPAGLNVSGSPRPCRACPGRGHSTRIAPTTKTKPREETIRRSVDFERNLKSRSGWKVSPFLLRFSNSNT